MGRCPHPGTQLPSPQPQGHLDALYTLLNTRSPHLQLPHLQADTTFPLPRPHYMQFLPDYPPPFSPSPPLIPPRPHLQLPHLQADPVDVGAQGVKRQLGGGGRVLGLAVAVTVA